MLLKLDALHPAVCVTAGFFLAVLIQREGGACLAVVVFALLCFVWVCARQKMRQVLKRVRYIFLALFVLFAWQTPGLLLWPELGAFSPSKEGLELAADQALRLLGVACIVAALLQQLNTAGWMAGLHLLLQPFDVLGFSTDRFILRLCLVLDYVAERELHWRHVLDEAEKEQPMSDLYWSPVPLARLDALLMLGMVCVFLGVLWWQG